MTAKQLKIPVMTGNVTAGFINGDTGLKPTSNMTWDKVYITAEELADVVEKVCAPLLEGGMKNMGKAISAIMADYKGRVDGKAVSEAVKARLQQAN